MTPAKTSRTPAKRRPNRGPSEIAPGIFVGGWKEALAFHGTRFCVLDEAPPEMPPATHIPLYDGGKDAVIRKNLDRLADSVRKASAGGEPVLIFCGMGVRRGALGGAWYLHRTEGIPLEEAYAKVRAARPQIEDAGTWVGDTSGLD